MFHTLEMVNFHQKTFNAVRNRVSRCHCYNHVINCRVQCDTRARNDSYFNPVWCALTPHTHRLQILGENDIWILCSRFSQPAPIKTECPWIQLHGNLILAVHLHTYMQREIQLPLKLRAEQKPKQHSYSRTSGASV